MPWTRKLKAPILLNDDRRVETLSDARKIIQGLPRTPSAKRALAICSGPSDGRR
jgi:hypothetical protein